MVYSFAYGIYIFLVTLLSGFLLYRVLYGMLGMENKETGDMPSLSACLILGVIAVSSFTAAVSFFHPIDLFVHLAVVLVLTGGGLVYRKEIANRVGYFVEKAARHKFITGFLILIYITAISEAAGLVSISDTGNYHIPLVKWLNSYGLVKGLANLQDTLGFMSGWFYFASIFDLGMFDDLTYHVINALAYTWGWGFVAMLFTHFLEGTFGAKDFLIIPLSIYLGSKVHFIASISPQLVFSIMAFWVIYESISLSLQKKVSAFRLCCLYLAAAYCVFLKISTAPVLLFLIYPSIRFVSRYRKFNVGDTVVWQTLRILLPASILAVITLSQNIILTGYPFYPVGAIDVVNVDWKVPKTEVRALADHVRKYAVDRDYYEREAGKTDISPGFAWVPEWIDRNLSRRGKTATVLGFMFLPVSIMVSLFKLFGSEKKGVTIPLGSVFFGLAGTVVIWFVTSPNLRFGAVWILAAFCFPLALFLELNRETVRRYLPGMGIVYFFILIFWMQHFLDGARLYERTVGEDSYLTTWLLDLNTPEYRQIMIADSTGINFPTREGRPPIPWNIPLPSVGQEMNYKGKIDTAIVRRGPSLGDGFKPAFQNKKEEG